MDLAMAIADNQHAFINAKLLYPRDAILAVSQGSRVISIKSWPYSMLGLALLLGILTGWALFVVVANPLAPTTTVTTLTVLFYALLFFITIVPGWLITTLEFNIELNGSQIKRWWKCGYFRFGHQFKEISLLCLMKCGQYKIANPPRLLQFPGFGEKRIVDAEVIQLFLADLSSITIAAEQLEASRIQDAMAEHCDIKVEDASSDTCGITVNKQFDFPVWIQYLKFKQM